MTTDDQMEFKADDLDTPTEADLKQCYGSKYLGAADIGDKKIRAKILKIRKEVLQQQGGAQRPKFVIYFANLEKPMVLNSTNTAVLVNALGRPPELGWGRVRHLLSANTIPGPADYGSAAGCYRRRRRSRDRRSWRRSRRQRTSRRPVTPMIPAHSPTIAVSKRRRNRPRCDGLSRQPRRGPSLRYRIAHRERK